jgi:hypothetical protein
MEAIGSRLSGFSNELINCFDPGMTGYSYNGQAIGHQFPAMSLAAISAQL